MRQHKAKERVLQDVVLYYVYFRQHARTRERERGWFIPQAWSLGGLKPSILTAPVHKMWRRSRGTQVAHHRHYWAVALGHTHIHTLTFILIVTTNLSPSLYSSFLADFFRELLSVISSFNICWVPPCSQHLVRLRVQLWMSFYSQGVQRI